jgi:thiol-disulfide isomerase/thioredoxin
MRLLYLVLLIGCLTGSAVAQTPGEVATAVPAGVISPEDAAFNAIYAGRAIPVVTGRLLNLSADELSSVTVKYTLVIPFSQFQLTKMAVVRPDGSFSLQLDNALPYQQIWFDIKDLFYTALYANKDLYVELDMKKLKAANGVEFSGEGVRYLGTDGPVNTYLNKFELYKRPEQNALKAKASELFIRKGLTDTMRVAYAEIYDSAKRIENSYIAATPSPYGWILENERLSDYDGQIILKYWGKTMDDSLWQMICQHKAYLTSNNSSLFYNYLATYVSALPGARQTIGWKDIAGSPDLDARDRALIDSLQAGEKMQPVAPYTPDNIQKWINKLQRRIQTVTIARTIDESIRRLDSLFPPAKADFLKLKLNAGQNLSDQQQALDDIRNSMHTAWCLALLNKEYDRMATRLSEVNLALAASATNLRDSGFGRPLIRTPFGASLYDASGMKALDLLARLKQGFPDKALIIDRWATWCGACIGEMPHSKELQEESANLPVVFVYLCTTNGSSEEKWKQKVTELKQPGIHILIDESLDAELSAFFSFGGYPGYALIDQSGKYRRGAITWISTVEGKDALEALIK